jgi:hypothetical protein
MKITPHTIEQEVKAIRLSDESCVEARRVRRHYQAITWQTKLQPKRFHPIAQTALGLASPTYEIEEDFMLGPIECERIPRSVKNIEVVAANYPEDGIVVAWQRSGIDTDRFEGLIHLQDTVIEAHRLQDLWQQTGSAALRQSVDMVQTELESFFGWPSAA